MIHTRRRNSVIRAFVGYRLIFNDSARLKLDSHLFPIVSYGRNNQKKLTAAYYNVSQIISRVPHHMIPAFLISNAVYELGKLPYVFESFDTNQAEKMWNIYVDWISHDAEVELSELLKKYTVTELSGVDGKSKLFDLSIGGEISVQVILLFQSKYNNIDISCIDTSKSLVKNRLKVVLDNLLYLQSECYLAEYFVSCKKSLID